VRHAELGRHLVELQRELADLIRRLDRHAVIELAAAEALHAEAQPLERPGEARAQDVSRGGADQYAGHGETGEEPELPADRRRHDGPWMLDDHAPADVIDAQPRRHRLDAALVGVGAADAVGPVLLEQGPDERSLDQRQALEHETHIVRRDELAAPVHDVGAAALPRADVRGQGPELLEIQNAHDEQAAVRGAG
jgi:hypothetical protein